LLITPMTLMSFGIFGRWIRSTTSLVRLQCVHHSLHIHLGLHRCFHIREQRVLPHYLDLLWTYGLLVGRICPLVLGPSTVVSISRRRKMALPCVGCRVISRSGVRAPEMSVSCRRNQFRERRGVRCSLWARVSSGRRPH
jgi:hypothetical protein